MSTGIYKRKPFTKTHCNNISKGLQNRKLTKEHREAIRLSLIGNHRFGDTSGDKNGMFGKSPQWKRIKYRDILMRSTWEVKFAQFLDLSGIEYQYESKRFNLKNYTYLPDFYLPRWNLYIEIKGYWHPDRKKRFRKFKRLYPQIKIKVLKQKDLQKMGVLR